MRIFRNYTFSWWQMAIFKLCLLAIGIAIGSYWHKLFSPYAMILVVVGVIIGIYLAIVSFKRQ
ncbi:MAG: hypothetical protein A2915_04595 [Candidatus Yanofskybacteria bacterium RIFCSPLOWO2_01_FULL_41_34]|nr:MAG: hypothetical protein A2915_04595 [Candidatus Yanofskybacteria bacterium RIFCSPLOWO2_01_FULL_41_34]